MKVFRVFVIVLVLAACARDGLDCLDEDVLRIKDVLSKARIGGPGKFHGNAGFENLVGNIGGDKKEIEDEMKGWKQV